MQPLTQNHSEIAAAYVEYLRSHDPALQWSFDAAVDYWLEERWDDLWELVKAISVLPQDIDDKTFATVSAGALEDLLDKAGPAYIEQVLDFAGQTPRLGRMLTGVWPSSIEPEVWARVVEFCRKVPNPIDGTYRY